MNQPGESDVSQPSFPLFKPARRHPDDEMFFSLADVVHREVMRASLDGPDPDAIEKTRFTLDLPTGIEEHLQALATAMGSSRRAMAAKLLTGAILETLTLLQQADESEVETKAVWLTYCEALDELRKARAA